MLFAQEMARDCGDRLFCETVTKESIDYDEYVRASVRPSVRLSVCLSAWPRAGAVRSILDEP